ncbi:MAG: hypothetical protein ACXWCP_22105 [Burkholderiales bacterium]
MKKTPNLPGEFKLIARYFAPLATGFPGAYGLLDDAAVITPPPRVTMKHLRAVSRRPYFRARAAAWGDARRVRD